MRPVLVFRHGAEIPPGHLGRVLAESGFATVVLALDQGAPMPTHHDWSGIVSLGGEMGAYQEADHPWLADERRFLAEAVERDVPVFGICLGVQLLATALGGSARVGERGVEVAVMSPALTPDGEQDPVLSQLDGPVPVWHGDTFELPPGAALLAKSDRYPHAFRHGSGVGVQAHPEATPEMVAHWTKIPAAARQLADNGIDAREFVAAVRRAEAATADVANRLFGAWATSLGSG
jgi:GMP synthase (glutamine-hydrolysing)